MANKPSYLTGGAGSGGHMSMKRGTEDLDFFIGDEALAAANGPGALQDFCKEIRKADSMQDMAYTIRSAMVKLKIG